MTAQELASAQLFEGIPALKLFEGLARLYEFVLVTDSSATVVWLSSELAALIGGAESHLGRDARRLIPALPKPEQGFAIRSELRQRGYIPNARVEVRCQSGAMVPVDVSIFPIPTEEVESPLLVTIARPAERTDRAQLDAMRASELADSILDGARNGVLVVDEGGFISYANPAIERLLGQTPEQLTQTPVAVLVGNALDLGHLISSLSPGEELCDQDLELRHSDGGTVQVSVSASPLHRGEAELGTILFLHDVTQRRKVDAELERKNNELEHCVQTLAHDLRSPLVALLGFSRLLRQDYGEQLDDTGTHFLYRIEQAGRTMESLIHDVLEFSRIGQPGELRSLVDPRAVLLQLRAEFKSRLEAAGIRLQIPEHPPLVYCDRTRLYQVFSNLIGNAIEHMGPCKDPHIDVEVEEAGEFHRIAVRDPGRGIAAEHHEKIFQVFQSIAPRSDGLRGTGIGLAIVKKIAETHSGRVWVESSPGGGTTFYLTLPRH